jgi:polyisoprenoid-binding protein YceI
MMTTVSFALMAQYQVKSFKMAVSGTSTLHNWESPVTKVTAKADMGADATALQTIKSLVVDIEAKSIKSTKGKVMDTKTWETLKADQHPKISYKLTKIESLTKTGAEYKIKTTGNLTIAGVTKSVPMEVKGKVLANGDLEFSGSRMIVLADYQMEQPTAMMGTVKVGKEVTVTFSVVMSSAAPQ